MVSSHSSSAWQAVFLAAALTSGATAQHWTDLGAGTVGSNGIPQAAATAARFGRPLQMRVRARPSSNVWFVLGLSRVDLSVLGGLLVPSPDIVLPTTTQILSGQGTATFQMPDLCGVSLDLYLQVLVQDPGAPSGFAYSHALMATMGEDIPGDINGDGYSDLVVGSPNEAVGSSTKAGAISVIYGSPSDLHATGAQILTQGRVACGGTIEGTADTDDCFGSAIATGDFDGDGYYDVVVGSPGERVLGITEAGTIHIIYGSRAGLCGSRDRVLRQGGSGVPESPGAFDWFGKSVAVGDFDADGCDDIVVGVPFENTDNNGTDVINAGVVHVLWGSMRGVSGIDSLLLDEGGSMSQDDRFGWVLATGDFDSDAKDDLVIGRPYEDVGSRRDAGAVTILSNYSSLFGFLTTSSIHQSTSLGGVAIGGVAETFDLFGFSLATGDFDDDGSCDLAVGVPFEDINSSSAAGLAQLFYGAAGTGLTAQGQQSWNHGQLGSANIGFERLGYSLAAGDFNGDRVHDLAIGIPRDLAPTVADPNRRPGSVHIVYGVVGGPIGATHRLLVGTEDDDEEGWALAAFDFNGDCKDDLAVGVPGRAISGRDNAGAVRVWYCPSPRVRVRSEIWSQQNLPGAVEAGDRFGGALPGSLDQRPL